MHRRFTYPRAIAHAAAAALLVLAICATALASSPIAGKTYTGYTSAPAIHGHRGPVSFKVSSNGRRLMTFEYGNIACTPMNSFTGSPYTSAANIIKVGTITVSGSGGFSVTNAKSTYVNSKSGKKYVTTSTVAVKFKTAKSASGTVSWSQKTTGPGGVNKNCGPYELSFTATTK